MTYNLSGEEYDDIIETIFWNLSFNISAEETLKGFNLSKEDEKFIEENFKILIKN